MSRIRNALTYCLYCISLIMIILIATKCLNAAIESNNQFDLYRFWRLKKINNWLLHGTLFFFCTLNKQVTNIIEAIKQLNNKKSDAMFFAFIFILGMTSSSLLDYYCYGICQSKYFFGFSFYLVLVIRFKFINCNNFLMRNYTYKHHNFVVAFLSLSLFFLRVLSFLNRVINDLKSLNFNYNFTKYLMSNVLLQWFLCNWMTLMWKQL